MENYESKYHWHTIKYKPFLQNFASILRVFLMLWYQIIIAALAFISAHRPSLVSRLYKFKMEIMQIQQTTADWRVWFAMIWILCSLADRYKHFRKNCCLHLQGTILPNFMVWLFQIHHHKWTPSLRKYHTMKSPCCLHLCVHWGRLHFYISMGPSVSSVYLMLGECEILILSQVVLNAITADALLHVIPHSRAFPLPNECRISDPSSWLIHHTKIHTDNTP